MTAKLIAEWAGTSPICSNVPRQIENLYLPKRQGDVGYDLAASIDVTCYPGELAIIPTGVYLQADSPLWYLITARSSFYRRGALVFTGIIDAGYQGELEVAVMSLKNTLYITKGERIAQLIFFTITHPHLRIVNEFQPTERGTNGFGSTGR